MLCLIASSEAWKSFRATQKTTKEGPCVNFTSGIKLWERCTDGYLWVSIAYLTGPVQVIKTLKTICDEQTSIFHLSWLWDNVLTKCNHYLYVQFTSSTQCNESVCECVWMMTKNLLLLCVRPLIFLVGKIFGSWSVCRHHSVCGVTNEGEGFLVTPAHQYHGACQIGTGWTARTIR